ncbi:hypothetical protein [Streptomyces sp. NPDC014685]|uniref:hypothetical protein n=1 Tax=Streptomyces sp. NPDC014685 TaxID=3364881 RepID=UPI0036FE1D6F
MTERIVIDVDRDGWTKGIQLNIVKLDANDHGWGFRLAGPKYNGSSTNLLRTELTERDAGEIRQALDAVFPLPVPALSRAEVLAEAAELAVRVARGCGDDEAGQYAASVAAGIGAELRRMAREAGGVA